MRRSTALRTAPAVRPWRQSVLVFAGVLLSAASPACNCAGSVLGGEPDPPAPPTVVADALQCARTFTLAGTKPSSTSIQIDGEEAVPFDATAVWQAEVTVASGTAHTFEIVALDALDRASTPTTFAVTLVPDAPAAPVVDPVPTVVNAAALDLTGSKEEGTGLWLDGVEVVAASAATAFTVPTTLSEGSNVLSLAASNGCHDSAVVTITTTYEIIIPPDVHVAIDAPQGGAFVTGLVIISGTAGVGSGFDEVPPDRVEITIDGGAPVTATGTDAWTFDWDTSTVSAAGHTIAARAFDAADNPSPMASITLTVIGSSVIVLSDQTGFGQSRRPQIATEPGVGGTAYVTWHDDGTVDNADGTNDNIYLRVVGAGGGAARRASPADPDGISQNASVAVDVAGVVHVVWQDTGAFDADADEDFDIIYRSFDGATASTAELVSTEVGDLASTFPHLALDPSDGLTLHLGWEQETSPAGDTDIFYARFDGTWSTPEPLSADATSDLRPRLAVDPDGNAHAVWRCTRDLDLNATADGDVCYARRTAAGVWETPLLVADAGTEIDQMATVAADLGSPNGLVHIVWAQGAAGSSNVRWRTRDVGAFGPPSELSDDAADSVAFLPAVAVDGDGNAAIAWVSTGGVLGSGADADVVLRRATPSIQAYEAVSDPDANATNTALSSEPAVAADADGNVFVVWQDRSNLAGADGDSDADDVFMVIR